MRTVLLIGTSHEYQRPVPEHASQGPEPFRALVATTCQQQGVKAVAEEMSLDALERHGARESVCKQVAGTLGIPHRYCDPSIEEQQALGVAEEGDIRMSGYFANRSREEIDAAVRTSDAIRERYWLEHLLNLDSWPVLFVCGANHTEPFRELLQAHGIEVRVLFAKWEPKESLNKSLALAQAVL